MTFMNRLLRLWYILVVVPRRYEWRGWRNYIRRARNRLCPPASGVYGPSPETLARWRADVSEEYWRKVTGEKP